MTAGFRVPLLFAALAAASGVQPVGAQPKAPPLVRAAVAETKPFADRIEALGTLTANESVELTAKTTETITSINFTDGQRVRRGDVLATLHKEEAKALLSEAASTADEARRQFERTRQLSSQGAASAAQLDEARRIDETARARQLVIESRIADLTIDAPFDGVLGLRNISVGALVRPGDLITTIDDDSVMKLDFSVPSAFLPVLVPGTRIEARARAFGDRVFEGEIRTVSSRVDPVTRTVVVRAEIPNPDRLLKPGLLMSVEVAANPRQAVTVPEGALLPAGSRTFVMVVEEGPEGPRGRRVEVATGARRAGEVEILSGLTGGQMVVTDGAFKAADGGPLKVAQTPEPGDG